MRDIVACEVNQVETKHHKPPRPSENPAHVIYQLINTPYTFSLLPGKSIHPCSAGRSCIYNTVHGVRFCTLGEHWNR